MKWEYRALDIFASGNWENWEPEETKNAGLGVVRPAALENTLNALGADGWELVGLGDVGESSRRCILKRPYV